MQRKITAIPFVIVLSMVLVACGANGSAAPDAAPAKIDDWGRDLGYCYNPYFPIRADRTWTYNILAEDTNE